jgi:small conductance mechanosensitive channel
MPRVLSAAQTAGHRFDWQGFALYAVVAIAVGVVLSALIRRVIDGFARRHAATVRHGDPATILTRYRLLERLVTVAIFLFVGLGLLSRVDAASGFVRAILASSAVVALVVGLAIRSPLANLGAGIQMLFTQPFRLGDTISVGASTGTVEEMRLSSTVVRTVDGQQIFVPNEQLVGQAIANGTISVQARQVAVRVPVAAGEDVERAAEILREVVAESELPLPLPAGGVTVAELDRDGVWFEVVAWADSPAAAATLASDLRLRCAARLTAAGIAPGAPRV